MKSLQLNRQKRIWILAALFLALSVPLQARQDVGSVQLYYTGDHLELLIESKPDLGYTVSETNDRSIAVRFENASASAIHKDPNYLWNFIPVTTISDMARYSTVFMKIHFDKGTRYRLTHKMRSNGLHLYLWGDIVKQFEQKVFAYASQKYDQLTPEQQKAILSVFEGAQSSDNFLLSEVKQAQQNGQFTWMDFLVTEMQKRDLLSGTELKQIATMYDQGGRADLSEPLWYEYYQQQVNSGANPYEDTLPVNVNIKKSPMSAPNSKPGPTSFAARLSRSQLPNVPFRTIALWSIGLLSILLIGGSVFHLIKQKHVSATAHPEITKQEQVKATFAEKLAQMRSTSQEAQPDKSTATKIDSRPTPTERPHWTPSEKEEPRPVAHATEQKFQTRPEKPNQKSDSKKRTDSDIPRMRKRREVERLYKQGHSLPRIARSLNLSEGEVTLLLKLGEGDQRQPKMRVRKDVANIEGKSIREIAQLLKISEEEAKLIQMTRSKA